MASNDKLHIAMFPWLAFGHMMPFLELAKLIAQKGHKISFISTPHNVDRLPKPPPHLSSLITFVRLPLTHENLPPKAEATTDVPLEHVWYLKNAYDLLQEPLRQFLQSSHPDCILFDFVSYWLPGIARQLNVLSVYFSIFNAACLGIVSPPSGQEDYRNTVEDYIVTPKWVPFHSTVAYRLFEALKCFHGIKGDESNTSDFYRFRQVMTCSDLIAVRSCSEFEPEWLNLLVEIHRKPVIPIGVLAPAYDDNEDEQKETWRSIKKWLDMQQKRSVVYIAFGSEAKPNQQEVTEIALGLELSDLPFFWVLRKSCLVDNEAIELPEGFEERTKLQGVVCTSWAPQARILAHDSVGGFLNHAGWSSAVEALQFGRALVFLTFYADQGPNAKLFEEKKIGYLIPRNERDGSFDRNAVADSLRLVMVEEEGKIYRDKATEMKGLFGDRDRHDHYVENFLGYIKTSRVSRNNGK